MKFQIGETVRVKNYRYLKFRCKPFKITGVVNSHNPFLYIGKVPGFESELSLFEHELEKQNKHKNLSKITIAGEEV